jgi:hypothetical protein
MFKIILNYFKRLFGIDKSKENNVESKIKDIEKNDPFIYK